MNIIEQLKRDEGVMLHAYQDHLGYWTIGVGFLIDERKNGGLRIEEIDFILQNRLAILTKELAIKLPWFLDLSTARQGVLVNMAFQLGVNGLLAFKNTLALIQQGKYFQAATEMLNSKWAKQTPKRANRLAEQMRLDKWQ